MTERFGGFLVRRGIVPVAQVVKALEIQRDRQYPVGRIAMLEEFLSVEQIFELLDIQDSKDHELFGEIALELGYLDKDQLAELLQMQKETRPRLGETLVELGALTEAQLEKALADFHEERDS